MNTNVIQKGFTLVELMIVVAIIGILASIALPNYTNYVKRGKAAEATSTLAQMRNAMERWYQDNPVSGYTGAPCTVPTDVKYFSYACAIADRENYTITASPVAGQGMNNFQFTIDEGNNKTSNFDGTTGPTCWLTSKQGTC